MPDLQFQVDEAAPILFAATPQLAFKLRITADTPDTVIPAIVLRCQIRIEPTRRSYEDAEAEGLLDLFGERSRWGQTLRGLLWTHISLAVPAFTGSTLVDLPVPCSFDFNVAATKYFAALEEGDIPLRLLFSGTVFHEADDGALQVALISWEKEADYRFPVRIWREMRDAYYPNTAWICLRRDLFERVERFRTLRGLPTWEHALECLLAKTGEEVLSP